MVVKMLARIGALFLCLHAAAAAAAHHVEGVTSRTIRFGMSAPMSGTAGTYGRQMKQGIDAAFAEVNARGGIHGRALQLVSLDDGYETEAAVANAKQLIDNEHVFALLAFYGSSPTTAVLPVLDARNVPLVGTISGADALRNPCNPHVFNLRASYGDETAAIVKNLTTLGVKRVAVFYQDDGFGQSGLRGVVKALAEFGLAPVAQASVPRNSVAVAQAVATIAKAAPQAVIMVTLHKPSAEFVREIHETGLTPLFVALSPVGTDQLVADLGEAQSRGIQVVQVMPDPWADRLAIVRDYKKALAAFDRGANGSYYGLEGYINARLIIAALQRAGAKPTRERLTAALRRGPFDLGGYRVAFARGSNEGSRYVEISVVGDDGQVIN
jgi:branched-chain amino acid transport system substrate-binding protein